MTKWLRHNAGFGNTALMQIFTCTFHKVGSVSATKGLNIYVFPAVGNSSSILINRSHIYHGSVALVGSFSKIYKSNCLRVTFTMDSLADLDLLHAHSRTQKVICPMCMM